MIGGVDFICTCLITLNQQQTFAALKRALHVRDLRIASLHRGHCRVRRRLLNEGLDSQHCHGDVLLPGLGKWDSRRIIGSHHFLSDLLLFCQRVQEGQDKFKEIGKFGPDSRVKESMEHDTDPYSAKLIRKQNVQSAEAEVT